MAAEAPISKSLLGKRVLSAWGIARMGARLKRRLDEILAAGRFEKTKYPVALLSGDGAGVKRDVGFFADLKRLVTVGWSVELYSWEETCHGDLKSYVEEIGKYINLNEHYEEITFIEGGRRAISYK